MRHGFRGIITAGYILLRSSGYVPPTQARRTSAWRASALLGIPFPLHYLPLPRQWNRWLAQRMSLTPEETRHHPSALRNRGFIATELKKWLGEDTQGAEKFMLEIASGTGCHAEAYAQHLQACWTYQPTEYDEARIPDIVATIDEGKHRNIRPPRVLDVCSDPSTWPRPVEGGAEGGAAGTRLWDAVVCCNMIHISPQECTDGLLKGSAAGLKMGGHLFVYGPFALNGLLIPDSNKSFDAGLKARSGGTWGIRDVAWVTGLAYEYGLELTAMTLMPANNFFVVFTKVRDATALNTSGGDDESKARVAELVAEVVIPAREAMLASLPSK